MLKNYIKIALRNLWKGRVFNAMNLVGLSVAIACCTLLFLTISFEFSYDKFHQNLPNIYQLYLTYNRTQGIEKNSSLSVPLAPALKADYQDIEHFSRMANGGSAVRYGDKQIGENIKFVDEDFLNIFTFPVINGNTNRPLKELNSVVITQYAAKAIFGSVDPIGKTLEMDIANHKQSAVVTAVAKDFPDNSSIQFDMLMRIENIPGYHDDINKWDHEMLSVFVQMNPQTKMPDFERRLNAFVEKHYDDRIKNIKRDGAQPDAQGRLLTLNAAPYAKTHFNTDIGGNDVSTTSPSAVIALMVIGGFILVIACINFVNLSIARSFTRAREVGVRKTLGASRWQLISQFWTETVILCFCALIGGLTLASITLSGFKAAMKTNIHMSMLLQPAQLLGILGMFLLITIIAGFYPALIMLRYKTVQVLKGTVNTVKPGKVRNTLLVVQFGISTLLIVCTMITWQQINFVQNAPLGYNKTEVMSIPVGRGLAGDKALSLFRNVMRGDVNVLAMSGVYDNLGRGKDGAQLTSINGFNYNGHELRTTVQKIDYDYIKTLDIKMLDGRDFSRDFPADSDALVINESMAKLIGKNALGAAIPMDDVHPQRVIGIFKDYNFRSLHQAVTPLTLVLDKNYPINYILIKVRPGSLVKSFENIGQKWKATFPTHDFTGSWINENTEKQYQKEKRLSTIFIASAIIAIVISCIGLVAISLMIMVQRTKEIGIRKVLGSSVTNIVMLMSADFIKLVALAALISFPIGYWVMHSWLSGFAYRIDIHWWVFALAGIMAVVIAFITISFQSIRAALVNPTKSLKSE